MPCICVLVSFASEVREEKMIKYVFLKRDVVVTSLFFIHIMGERTCEYFVCVCVWWNWRGALTQKNDVKTEPEISFIFYCLFMTWMNQMWMKMLQGVQHQLLCCIDFLLYFILPFSHQDEVSVSPPCPHSAGELFSSYFSLWFYFTVYFAASPFGIIINQHFTHNLISFVLFIEYLFFPSYKCCYGLLPIPLIISTFS
jgi:hypothetical protein